MEKKLKSFEPLMADGQHQTWEGKHGLMYKFKLSFEDNSDADAMSKSQQPKWQTGDSFTVTENGQYRNAKKVQDNNYTGGGGGGKSFKDDPLKQQLIIAQSSIKIAMEMVTNENVKKPDGSSYGLEDLEPVTDRVMQIINKLANKHNS